MKATDFTKTQSLEINTLADYQKIINGTTIINDTYIGDKDYSMGRALPLLDDDFAMIGYGLIAKGENAVSTTIPSQLPPPYLLGRYEPKGVILTDDIHTACKIFESGAGVIFCDELPLMAEMLECPFKIVSNRPQPAPYDTHQVILDGHITKYKIKALFGKDILDFEALEKDRQILQNAIEVLAELDDLSFALALPVIAKAHGISQRTLAGFVVEYKQGDLVKDTPAHKDPQTAKDIYQALYKLIDEHIIIDEPYKVAFVLWVLFTYLVDLAQIAPLAWITSPEKQCGKSTLFGLFARVVHRPFTANNITQAVLYRLVDKYRPCLIDTSLKDKGELLGIVNAGHSKHACHTPRINSDNGNAIEAFNAFGAKVFAGIGEM